jgi:hypothetical protein
MTIKTDLPKLAEKLLTMALGDDVTSDFRIDTFKAVATYHLASQKVAKGKQPEDPGNVTFGQLVNNIKQKEGHA